MIAPAVKVELDRNYVKVGDDYQTSVKGVYAAGDIIGPPWLAHVATFEAVSAVNGIFGHGKAASREKLSRAVLIVSRRLPARG